MLDASLEHERWLPVYATKLISASLVDLFQCLSQTADFYLETVHPSPAAHRTLDNLLAEMIGAIFAYAGRIKAVCGDATDLLAPLPELRRTAAAAAAASSSSAITGGADAAVLPPAVVSRFEALPPAALCTMINNVHSCALRCSPRRAAVRGCTPVR